MRISTVIPVYKNIDFLLPAVRSVFTSNKYDHQVIIVDDGNEAHTAKKIENYKNIPGVEIVRLEKNLGLANARNAGLRHADGNYVRFLDGDDEFTWGGLERQLECMAKDKTDIVVGRFKLVDRFNEKSWNIEGNNTDPLNLDEAYKSFLFFWERGLSIPIHSALFKREAIIGLGNSAFPTGFRAKEDWIFWCNLARSGAKFSLISDDTALYRQHGGNMCVSDPYGMARSFLEAAMHLHLHLDDPSDLRSQFMTSSLDHFFRFYIRVIENRVEQKNK
ncbi:glycosyltransferase family 2 protein [Bdellovibrio bacteriovorus]|uniref:glycosyltransferase family 2 protein n=1 Tax=Bdellovibrio bacteriovorus TaxID=959 RepID=UPI0035A6D4F0